MILSSYTRALKRYDPDLFADRTRDGVAAVFRWSKRYEPVCELEGVPLFVLKADRQFVFALTDNWKAHGVPRIWGIDFVLNRVKEIDVLANERFFEEMDEQNERVDKSKAREIKNEMEGFWSHERKRFAKTMDESIGCIHSISKDEPRKRLKDRSIKNGNN